MSAECAAADGRFREASDYLFGTSRQTDDTILRDLAPRAGVVDIRSYEACLVSTDVRARIHADILDAQALGLAVTPVIIIGKELYGGVPWDFEDLVLSASHR